MSGDRFYTTSAWRRARAAVLERDGGRCRIGARGCLGVADQVDHIVPMSAGGSKLDPANLRAACGPCNGGRVRRGRSRRSSAWLEGPVESVPGRRW